MTPTTSGSKAWGIGGEIVAFRASGLGWKIGF